MTCSCQRRAAADGRTRIVALDPECETHGMIPRGPAAPGPTIDIPFHPNCRSSLDAIDEFAAAIARATNPRHKEAQDG